MKKFITNIALVLILFLSSCGNPTEVTPVNNENLIPLKINNQWHYNVISYRYNPDDSLTTFFDSTSVVMEVIKYDSLGSYKGFRIDYVPFWISLNSQHPLYYYKEDGFYFANPSFVITIPPSPPTEKRLLLYPSNVGDQNNYDGYTILTAEKNESVKLYSNTYHCIRYEVMYKDEIVGMIWIAPDIGVVKTWQKVGSMTYNYFLSSCKLNNTI